jgi:hypothetical protein
MFLSSWCVAPHFRPKKYTEYPARGQWNDDLQSEIYGQSTFLIDQNTGLTPFTSKRFLARVKYSGTLN